ncbi:MAG: hypothetical protein ACRC7N_07445 [Clostridium sp.]
MARFCIEDGETKAKATMAVEAIDERIFINSHRLHTNNRGRKIINRSSNWSIVITVISSY